MKRTIKRFPHAACAIMLGWLTVATCLTQPSLAKTSGGAHFEMRGVVLSVEDLESAANWAELAHETGINTIGTHVTPEQVAKYAESEKGKKFFAGCKKYGILVEHQLHAMRDLLPRELFDETPSMFRMDESGRRVGDYNFCVHSEKALGIVAENAARYARRLPATNHRYYFWFDDNKPSCRCPECSKYSVSELALIVENRMIREIRKVDPLAQLAHLAYLDTMAAPRKVRPAKGIFLEFAPIGRSWTSPLSDHNARGGRNNETHGNILRQLQDNLTVFPAETAVVLEYWLDISLFSRWKKPAVKIPWEKDVFESDLKTYAGLGIKNITTFAVYADAEYLKTHPEFRRHLEDYGTGLKNFIPSKNEPAGKSYEMTPVVVRDGLMTIDGEKTEPVWAQAARVNSFVNPWDLGKPPETSLSVLNDSQNVYFLFEAKDDELVLASDYSGKRDVEKEDRVELFFSKDKGMNEYYGFEMDPLGRVLSYQCRYYRNFDFSWSPPPGFSVRAKIQPGGYVVECAIPLAFFKDFDHGDGVVYFGAYRADFRIRDGKIIENWLSWKDSLTLAPDFHVPASLGKLILKRMSQPVKAELAK